MLLTSYFDLEKRYLFFAGKRICVKIYKIRTYLKMDYQISRKLCYWTYFEAESSNAQFSCHFAFPFFKFLIIPSPYCDSFKCTRIPTGNGTSFLNVAFEIDISHNFYYSCYKSKGALESFWHNIHLPQSISLVQSETVA